MTVDTRWQTCVFGDVAKESTKRLGEGRHPVRVFGVDRHTGLTPETKYSSTDLSRYKVISPGMFAYNPMRLNIGSIAYCDKGDGAGAVSPDYVVFGCCDNRLDHGFLKYFIRGSEWQGWTTAAGVGSVRVRIYFRELATMPLRIPPLPEQKRIAHILGTLDDKIELNRRMNATLEGISRAIFKSWFVDFDPVRQKAAGKQPVGMDEQTAALFPDSFEDSAIGEVPKGWATCTLDDYTQLVIGGDWGESERSSEATAACLCVRGADIPSLQDGGIGKMPTRYLKPASLEKRRLLPWDLVVEISGGSPTQSTGRPVLVTDGLLARLPLPLIASNFCRILKLKEKQYSPFVYFYLRHLYDAEEFLQYENGTTGIKNFAYTLFAARHSLLAPDHRVLAAFAAAITPTVTLHQQKARESDSLAALRATLLPKLLSGEVRVPEEEEALA
jgi:type I restriction enzyme S subunit